MCFELAASCFFSSWDYEESCGATLLAFSEEFTPLRRVASKSEGRKNQRLPIWRPGICPSRAKRLTVLGCSRKKRAASMQFQAGSIVSVMFVDIFLS